MESVTESVKVEISRILVAEDHYGVLNIDKVSCSRDQVRTAYKKLAVLLHPDKCKLQGGTEAFKKISEAYSTLSDDDKRRQYDMPEIRSAFSNPRGGFSRPTSSAFSAFDDPGFRFQNYESSGIDVDDIFYAFFNDERFKHPKTTFSFVHQGTGGPFFRPFSDEVPWRQETPISRSESSLNNNRGFLWHIIPVLSICTVLYILGMYTADSVGFGAGNHVSFNFTRSPSFNDELRLQYAPRKYAGYQRRNIRVFVTNESRLRYEEDETFRFLFRQSVVRKVQDVEHSCYRLYNEEDCNMLKEIIIQ